MDQAHTGLQNLAVWPNTGCLGPKCTGQNCNGHLYLFQEAGGAFAAYELSKHVAPLLSSSRLQPGGQIRCTLPGAGQNPPAPPAALPWPAAPKMSVGFWLGSSRAGSLPDPDGSGWLLRRRQVDFDGRRRFPAVSGGWAGRRVSYPGACRASGISQLQPRGTGRSRSRDRAREPGFWGGWPSLDPGLSGPAPAVATAGVCDGARAWQISSEPPYPRPSASYSFCVISAVMSR